MQSRNIIIIMRKTANYRVIGLSRFCTDPEVAEIKMRKAMGWGLQLQSRVVRKIKLERLLRNSEEIQMEVSKAVDAKARWEDMDWVRREESEQTKEEAEEEERRETEVYNKQEGILKLYNMRVTDLPTNKEVYLPDERPNDVEVGLQAFSAEMLEVARIYQGQC